jgi:two-component system chemotaxis response regulator CheB
LEAGALTVLPKLRGFSTDDAESKSLIQQIKMMAGVKVVRRTSHVESQPGISGKGVAKPAMAAKNPLPSRLTKPAQLVAIGLSTGGPPALQTILSGLPPSFPLPIVVVQHISPGFMFGLAAWLSNATPFQCKVGELGLATYVCEFHPRDIDHPQFTWTFQRQFYDNLHDCIVKMFTRNPQLKE